MRAAGLLPMPINIFIPSQNQMQIQEMKEGKVETEIIQLTASPNLRWWEGWSGIKIRKKVGFKPTRTTVSWVKLRSRTKEIQAKQARDKNRRQEEERNKRRSYNIIPTSAKPSNRQLETDHGRGQSASWQLAAANQPGKGKKITTNEIPFQGRWQNPPSHNINLDRQGRMGREGYKRYSGLAKTMSN